MAANILILAAFGTALLLTILSVLMLRWWGKREERRSPLQNKQIGHVPGQQLVARVADSQEDLLLSTIVMYFSFPVMLMAWALQRIPPERMRIDANTWMFLVGALLMFMWGLRSFQRHWRARQKARDGLLAERVTGMQLNRLVAQGCIVLHDVPSDTGNIDHVVIAPRGLYAIETKSFRKPRDAGELRNQSAHQVNFDGRALRFPDFTTSKPIDQSMRHADWLRRYLREAIQQDIPVIAAVALPGWYVVQADEVWRSSSVKVFSPLGEGTNFMAKEVVRIEPDYRGLIAKAIALKFPVAS